MPDQALLQRLLRPEVLALSAYHVADARGLIKLDAMENPFSWPEDLQDAWLANLRGAAINRYPDPAAQAVQAALREHDAVPEPLALMLGNGSDELIQILLMAVARPGATIMAPEPTFVMYRQIALSLGLKFVGVPLHTDDFELDTPAMLAAIATHAPAVIFLAYPNNPTGNLFSVEAIAAILEASPGLVVVDEAYAPFAGATYVPHIHQHERLLVMRTLSKLGLAGLRLGYLMGDPAWIAQLDKLRLPYNINVLTQRSVVFALQHAEVFNQQVSCLLQQRESLQVALASFPGIQVYPSAANFITVRLLAGDATETHQRLKSAGVLIKNLHVAGGPLQQCLRITVGTAEENQQFLSALRVIRAAGCAAAVTE